MTSSKPKIAVQHNVPEDIADSVKSTYGMLLTITFIIVLSIIISGHLLGYVLGLKNNTNDKDHISIPIPLLFKISAIGKHAIAGLASFLLVFLLVLSKFIDNAEYIFITKLAITDSCWVASQTLAALVSVATCIALSACRLIIDTIKSIFESNKFIRSSDDDIIKTLTNKKNQE